MKKILKYTLPAACILALSACSEKVDPVPEADGPEIRFAVTENTGTKGLLDQGGLNVSGTQLHVLKGFIGTANGHTSTDLNTPITYIDGIIEYDEDTAEDYHWPFVDPAAPEYYRWTKTGTHNFFGWLVKDNTGNAALTMSGISYGETNVNNALVRKLTVPTIEFTPNTAQFDLLYSNTIGRDATNTAHTSNPVPLDMLHFFSAVAISIENNSDNVVHLQSITLEGLNNKKSGSVTFAETEGDATADYSVTGNVSTNILRASSTLPANFSKNDHLDLLSTNTWTEENFILMWPQTSAEINAAKFIVTYTMEGAYNPEPGHETELLVFETPAYLRNIPVFSDAISSGKDYVMEAGKKYAITLQFKGNSLDLRLQVLPWTYTYFDLDYSASTISANVNTANDGVLWLYTQDGAGGWTAGSRDTRTVVMESGTTVKGDFHIASPHSGKWQITTYPAEAAQYFKMKVYNDEGVLVEGNSGLITSELITGAAEGKVEFFLEPVGNVPSQQILHFNVAFQFNGETQWRDANSEFNRKDWKVIREH